MMRIFVCALAVVLVGFGALSCGRAGVEVSEGYLMTTDVVMFVVQSCHQQPQLELLRETADEVQVKVTTSTKESGLACQDAVICQLQEPLGERRVLDSHTRNTVPVRREAAKDLPPNWSDTVEKLTPCWSVEY